MSLISAASASATLSAEPPETEKERPAAVSVTVSPPALGRNVTSCELAAPTRIEPAASTARAIVKSPPVRVIVSESLEPSRTAWKPIDERALIPARRSAVTADALPDAVMVCALPSSSVIVHVSAAA